MNNFDEELLYIEYLENNHKENIKNCLIGQYNTIPIKL